MRLKKLLFASAKLLLLALGILGNSSLQAQSTSDLLPPESRSEINNSLSGALNGLVIFGSSSALGSGYYSFDSSDSPDTTLNVLRLFNDYKLADPATDQYIPFLNFGIGRVKVAEQIPPSEGEGQNDFSTLESTSVDLGMGVDLKVTDNFFLTPVFDLVYTHTNNNYDYNNEFSQLVLQLFDGNVFNWDVDTLSYNPGIKARYELKLGNATIIPSLSYTQVFVESISTSSDIIDVNTSSGVMNSRLKVEFPDVVSANGVPLTVVPQFSRTDLYGDARSGIGVDYFHEVSLAVIAKDQHFLPIFKDVGISSGITFGHGVSGWRVGLEGEL